MKDILINLLNQGLTRQNISDLSGVDRHTIRHLIDGKSSYLIDRTYQKFKNAFPHLLPDSNIWKRKQSDKKRCKEFRCFGWACSLGYCDKHYREFKEYGKIREASEKRAVRGSGHLDRRGYVRISNPVTGRQTFQHRVIVEQHLGRPLKKDENIHHINGIRNDNRIENLEIWSTSQPAGQKLEDKISWAKCFLEEYGWKVEKQTH